MDGWVIAGVVAAMVVALVTVVKAWHEFRVPIQRWWALRVESALEELHRLTLNASAIQARKERLRELVGLRPLLLQIVRNPPRDWNRPFELEGMKTEAVLELRRLGFQTFLDDAETDEATGEALVRFFEKVIEACDRRSLRLAERAWRDAKRQPRT